MAQNILAFFSILSPILAVIISIYYQRRFTEYDNEHRVFLTLMSLRNTPLPNIDWVNNLNIIEVVYANHPTILKMWHELFDILETTPLNEVKMNRKKIELLEEIGRTLGYKSLHPLDIQKFYTPIAHGNQIASSEKLQSLLQSVLEKLDNFLSSKTDNSNAKKSPDNKSDTENK